MDRDKESKISTQSAIVIAGIFIMIGILLVGTHNKKVSPTTTLSKQVGISKDNLLTCMKNIDAKNLNDQITASASSAMKGIPEAERGTPYSVVVGPNNVKEDIRGAYPEEKVKTIIDEVKQGKVTTPYTGELPPITKNDHIYGNSKAPVVIVEYSDFECPYCKAFHSTLKKIIDESNGDIAWVYRHFPLHTHSFEELAAAECVAKLKGNDAFWKYGDLLFQMLQTSSDSITDKL